MKNNNLKISDIYKLLSIILLLNLAVIGGKAQGQCWKEKDKQWVEKENNNKSYNDKIQYYFNVVTAVHPDGISIQDCETGQTRMIYTANGFYLNDLNRSGAKKMKKEDVALFQPGDTILLGIQARNIPNNSIYRNYFLFSHETVQVPAATYYQNSKMLIHRVAEIHVPDIRKFCTKRNTNNNQR